jgi:uncharacterized protein (TIGR02246 family)
MGGSQESTQLTPDSLADEESRGAISAVLDRVQAAWAAGDANQFGGAFAEDAIFVPFNGARLFGRAAIVQFHERPFAEEFRGGKLNIDLVDIRALSKDTYLVATNGGPARAGANRGLQETQSYIVRCRSDQWEIAFFQNTPVLPARDC